MMLKSLTLYYKSMPSLYEKTTQAQILQMLQKKQYHVNLAAKKRCQCIHLCSPCYYILPVNTGLPFQVLAIAYFTPHYKETNFICYFWYHFHKCKLWLTFKLSTRFQLTWATGFLTRPFHIPVIRG